MTGVKESALTLNFLAFDFSQLDIFVMLCLSGTSKKQMGSNVTAECITLALASLPPHCYISPGLVNGVVLAHPGALPLLVLHAGRATIQCRILKPAWPPWVGATLGR